MTRMYDEILTIVPCDETKQRSAARNAGQQFDGNCIDAASAPGVKAGVSTIGRGELRGKKIGPFTTA